MTEYLTIEEVCELLRLSDRSVYDLCRKGKLPGAAKVGGFWRVDRAKLTAWLDAGGDAGPSPSTAAPCDEGVTPGLKLSGKGSR